jgi:antitoxin ParD1/3/4
MSYRRSMQTERVTVTMPADDVARLRVLVEATGADSVSAYVADAVRSRLDRDQALAKLDELWGPLPEDAIAWAERTLDVSAPTRQAKAS